jgi:hypothetical protein
MLYEGKGGLVKLGLKEFVTAGVFENVKGRQAFAADIDFVFFFAVLSAS